MNSREFADHLCDTYHSLPDQMQPTSEQLAAILKCVQGLRLDGKQMELLYDQVLKDCKYFPQVAEVYSAAASLNLIRKFSQPQIAWETWVDERGRTWAKKKGYIQPESAADEMERWCREECSVEEGKEIFNEAFAMAAEQFAASAPAKKPIGNSIITKQVAEKSLGFEFEIVDDKLSWDDL